MKEKKFVAIIPARFGSEEVKQKNIVKIGGYPLISYTIQAAKASKFISKVYVTTDGKNIAKISKLYGANVIIRPKHLANKTINVDSAVVHAINMIEKITKKLVDNVVLLQPTSMLRNATDIDNAIKIFLKEKADSLFSCINIHPCIWLKKKYLKPLNFNPYNRKNRQNFDKTFIENGAIYITKKKIYKLKKNRLGGKISKYVMKNFSIFELDTKEDLKLLSILMRNSFKKIYKIITPKKI
tara:strand:+ start:1136 stop:1855 length:720 start_codon:yes stop_codon:yes gene_type:complete